MIVWLCMCMRMLLSVILFIEKEIKCYLVPSPNSYSSDGVIRAVIYFKIFLINMAVVTQVEIVVREIGKLRSAIKHRAR